MSDIGKVKKQVTEKIEKEYSDFLSLLLKRKHGGIIATLYFLLLEGLLFLFIYYWVFPNIILQIWNWGLQVWHQTIIAIIAELIIIPLILWVLSYPIKNFYGIITFYFITEEDQKILKQRHEITDLEKNFFSSWDERIHEINKKIYDFETEQYQYKKSAPEYKELSKRQAGFEEEKKVILDIRDIFEFFRFRRKHLTYYYDMNYNQTRKSFRYSIFAMFTGFFIILLGIASAFGFFSIPFPDFMPLKIDNVVIAGGVLAEMISALFLWTYKTSLEHLCFFYKYQVQAHNAFISYKIANSMGDQIKDKTKQQLVKSFLETLMSEPNIELPKTSIKDFKK